MRKWRVCLFICLCRQTTCPCVRVCVCVCVCVCGAIIRDYMALREGVEGVLHELLDCPLMTKWHLICMILCVLDIHTMHRWCADQLGHFLSALNSSYKDHGCILYVHTHIHDMRVHVCSIHIHMHLLVCTCTCFMFAELYHRRVLLKMIVSLCELSLGWGLAIH